MTIYIHLVKTQRKKNTHHEDHAGTLIQRLLAPILSSLLSSVGGTIIAIRVTTVYKYPGNYLTTSESSRSGVYPSSTPGWEAMIFVLLYSLTC